MRSEWYDYEQHYQPVLCGYIVRPEMSRLYGIEGVQGWNRHESNLICIWQLGLLGVRVGKSCLARMHD